LDIPRKIDDMIILRVNAEDVFVLFFLLYSPIDDRTLNAGVGLCWSTGKRISVVVEIWLYFDP
jgi:hypothetical protein